MQDLGLRINLALNDLTIKSAFSGLSRLNQESIEIAAESSITINTISKLFYLKTAADLIVKINNGTLQTFLITDTCLLTGAYNSIQLQNTSDAAIQVFVVYS